MTCECGNRVAFNARVCPHCGHRFTSLALKLFGVLILVFLVGTVIMTPSSTPTSSAPPPVTQAPPAPPVKAEAPPVKSEAPPIPQCSDIAKAGRHTFAVTCQFTNSLGETKVWTREDELAAEKDWAEQSKKMPKKQRAAIEAATAAAVAQDEANRPIHSTPKPCHWTKSDGCVLDSPK
jgi:hypothetical protein